MQLSTTHLPGEGVQHSFSYSQDNSVETRREVAIRGLMVYLREKEEELFKEEVNQTPLYFT